MLLSQTYSGKGRKSTLEHIHPPSIICNCASCAEGMFQLSLTTALYNSCSFEKPRECILRAQMLPILEHGRQPVTVGTVDAGGHTVSVPLLLSQRASLSLKLLENILFH